MKASLFTVPALLMTVFASASSFATTTVTCKSANYTVKVADIEDYSSANYGVNGVMNSGADVEMEEAYLSNRVMAFSLSVDGQPKKIEVSVIRSGETSYSGKIFFGKKTMQNTVCTRL